MLKKIFIGLLFFSNLINSVDNLSKDIKSQEKNYVDKCVSETTDVVKSQKKNVFKFVLENGLTILVVPVKQASQVSVQIWYNVGSKHEEFGERGMAHFIEHMVFKGTNEMQSESDANLIGSKLSAFVNAGTWYDYTLYYFTLPIANWDKVLPIFADWMSNCKFQQDHMNSEVKAIIQELKMRNDNYSRFLMLNMISTIFDFHPYHYTTIGLKQDLFVLKRNTLLNFYKKHYIPQNATIVLVGDLDTEQAKDTVKKHFGHIPKGKDVALLKSYLNEDLISKSVTIYRDIEQSIGSVCFVVPGLSKKTMTLYDILGSLLANGKSSRLYKKLVDEMGLASKICANYPGTYDYELFYLEFKPINEDDFCKIKEIILQEIENIIENGFTDIEIRRAIKFCRMEKQKELENVQSLAYKIGLTYVATRDENYIFQNYEGQEIELKEQLLNLLQNYFKESQCNDGMVRKVSCDDKKYLESFQSNVGKDDGAALAELKRESVVEAPKYANKVVGEKIKKKEFIKPELYTLNNGLEVMLCKTDAVDTVFSLLKLRADNSYTAEGFDGSFDLMCKMMIEGTKTYPGLTLSKEIESYGMNLSVVPGIISCEMLSSDVCKGFDFIRSIICEAEFTQTDFDRVKEKQKALIASFWDESRNIAIESAKDLVYKGHPYSKKMLGTCDSIEKIDRDFCFNLYKKYISPCGARLTVVGNFDKETIKQEVQKAFESWTGQNIDKIKFSVLQKPKAKEIYVEKNRDQVFLGFAGLSVKRLDKDYDSLLIFDQILAGTSIYGMDTLLFRLREQTGIFYTYGGSILAFADEEPGMIYIATMVAKDRVQEAYDAFMKVLTTSIDSITDQEFDLAKENIIASFCKNYDTNAGRALMFDFMRRYNLPFDYFEKRFDVLRNISKEEMIKAVKNLLQKDNLSFIKVGKC